MRLGAIDHVPLIQIKQTAPPEGTVQRTAAERQDARKGEEI
jgi:hypothetical protein